VYVRTQDYLQQAANSLRQAAVARKAEVDDLRKEIDDQDRFAKDQTNVLKRREAETLAQAANTESDRVKATRAREAQVMRVEESQISQEVNNQKRELSNLLKAKQKNVDELNNLAQSIESGWMQL
jgi:hypothetical protein